MPTFNITAPDGTRYRVEAPEGASEQDALAKVQEQHAAIAPQAPSARIADDFGALPRSPGDLMQTREVPKPGAPGGNYSSDITQRARNTAFGQGPGSVAGIPGAALPLAAEGAGVVGGAAARGFGMLPDWLKTGVVSGAVGLSAAAAKELGAPESLIKWLENMELVRQFGKHP